MSTNPLPSVDISLIGYQEEPPATRPSAQDAIKAIGFLRSVIASGERLSEADNVWLNSVVEGLNGFIRG